MFDLPKLLFNYYYFHSNSMKFNRSEKVQQFASILHHIISASRYQFTTLSCYQLHNFLNHNFFIFFNHFLVYMKNVPLVLVFVISKEFNKICRFMKFLLLLLDFSIEWVHKVLLITALFPRIPTTKWKMIVTEVFHQNWGGLTIK